MPGGLFFNKDENIFRFLKLYQSNFPKFIFTFYTLYDILLNNKNEQRMCSGETKI